MDLRLYLAILVGKIIAFVIRFTGGGATAAPGLFALKFDPALVNKLTKKLKYGSIVLSGTNGKTTTARLTFDLLSTKFKVIHNRAGSNLLRGIASTLITKVNLLGKCQADLGLWEVDEATLPEAIVNTKPKVITLLNLFRDQLDRYGEVDTIRNRWQKALKGYTLNKGVTLILNADDPGISILANSHKGKIVFFGINDKKLDLPSITHVADIRHCLRCGSNLKYSALLSSHMGHYTCPKCNFKRPTPQINASDLSFNPDFSTLAKLDVNGQMLNVRYALPGLYNAYNVLAAVAIGDELKIDRRKIKEKIESFSAAFGRFQSVKIRKKSVVIFLIKNPTGANEVIRTIADKSKINLLVILNDNIADGRDVSWIWDTNWEILASKIKSIRVSGIRSWDLATRLKYAGTKLSKNNVYENISYSIKKSLENMSSKDTLLILPTYTALLEVQKTLTKWETSVKWSNQ